jgi:hypothetical protein
MLLLSVVFLYLVSCAKAEVRTTEKPVLEKSDQLEEQIVSAVDAMANAAAKDGFQIVIDDVKLQDSPVITPAGKYIRDLVTTCAMKSKLFSVLQTKKEFLSTTNERVLEYLTDSDFDGFLQMNYYLEGDKLRLNFRLMKAFTPEIIYAGDVRIGTNLFPESLSFLPGNYDSYRANAIGEKTVATNDFRTDLWTDRGRNALYYKGDKMQLLVRSESDCYVKIYYTDVEGKVQLLFPNVWEKNNFLRAGQVYRIPNDSMSFELEMGEPYGVESVRLVAQDVQFDDLGIGANFGSSFRDEGEIKSRDAAAGIYTRGVTLKPVAGANTVKHSEAVTATTVAER